MSQAQAGFSAARLSPLAITSSLACALLVAFAVCIAGDVPIQGSEVFLIPVLSACWILPITLGLRKLAHNGSLPAWLNWLTGRSAPMLWIGLSALGSAMVVWLIFGKTLGARWWVYDDYEIMRFLGPAGRLGFNEIFPNLALTEAGNFGGFTRFRPGYYFFRLVECALWGSQPAGWFAFRMGIAGFSFFMLWQALKDVVGWLAAGLVCALTITYPLWADIFSRLGPGETYAVLGLALYGWAALALLRAETKSGARRVGLGAALLFATLLAAGSKENFLLLVLPDLYLAGRLFAKKDPILLGFLLASLVFMGYVGSGVLIGVLRAGTDVYAQSISLSGRLSNLLAALAKPAVFSPWLWLSACLLATAGLAFVPFQPSKKRALKTALAWLVGIWLLYASQLIFYNGDWPTGIRYDFPGILYIPASIGVLAWLAQKLLAGNSPAPLVTLSVQAAVGLTLALLISFKGFSTITRQVSSNVESTRAFSAQIDRVAQTLRDHEDYSLVIEVADSHADYEPAISIAVFLKTAGVKNQLFLRNHFDFTKAAPSSLEERLANTLSEISARGSATFSPIARLTTERPPCFSLDLSKNIQTECERIE